MKPNHFRLKLLATAVGMAVLATGSVAIAAPSASHSFANGVVAQATILRKGDVMVGALAQSTPMRITVALKLRNTDQLHTFIHAAHTTRGVMARTAMSNADFRASYSPTTAQARAVVRYLRSAGFTHITIQPGNTLVTAEGSAATATAAFKTSFAHVMTADGRSAYANTSAAHIPAALSGSVLSVLGLQSVHVAHTMSHTAPHGIESNSLTYHFPAEFPEIYGAGDTPTAAGVNIGIITAGDITQTLSDLDAFTDDNGFDPVDAVAIPSATESSDDSGVGEWNLDSQSIVGMSGGEVGKLLFYNSASLSNSDLTVDFNAAVNDTENAPRVINVSLGLCEIYTQFSGAAAAQDQVFMQAVAQGQTFSISTGDDGADQCGDGGTSVSWPASSQYVVAAGGTTLNTSNHTTWNGETVWSLGGGGSSIFEPKPSWQNGITPGGTRTLPDISYDADPNTGAALIIGGRYAAVYGGTSLAAPLFAGAWARILAAHPDLGFAAPLLYQLPSSDFHDIQSGDNGGQNAGPGYDLATGLGSMIIGAANADIGGEGGGGGGDNNSLQNGSTVGDIGATTGNDVAYTVNVPEGASNLLIASNNGIGNADLYVRFGSAPTLTNYDCRSMTRGNNESCTIAEPQAGTWYVTLHARRAFAGVSLKASWDSANEGGESDVFSNTKTKAIPDNGQVTSVLNITGEAAATAASVTINITHPYSGDLDIILFLPGNLGYGYHLKTPDGADSSPNYHQTFGLNITGLPTPINGKWKLQVKDVQTGDTGTLDDWSMEFQ